MFANLRAAIRLGIVIIALCFATGAKAGTVVPAEFASNVLGRAWAFNVYLPDGYATSRLRYPVLYLLHGIGQNRDEWVTKGEIAHEADLLIAAGQIPPCVIVMPSAGDSWFVDGPERMETAFGREFVPYIDQHYRTIASSDGRVIAGESMGGYGALRLLMLNPRMFSAAALLSPAVYVPEPPEHSSSRRSPAFQTNGTFDPALWEARNYPKLIDRFAAARVRVPVYIMSGMDDEFHIEDQAIVLYRAWRRHGWPGRLLLIAGRHNFDVWRPAMPDALRYIFRHVSRPLPETSVLTALPVAGQGIP